MFPIMCEGSDEDDEDEDEDDVESHRPSQLASQVTANSLLSWAYC